MSKWFPWVAAVVAWNLTFDIQVRTAGDRFVAEQLVLYHRGVPMPLLEDAFPPRVRRAAAVSSGVAALVMVGSLWQVRRRARRT